MPEGPRALEGFRFRGRRGWDFPTLGAHRSRDALVGKNGTAWGRKEMRVLGLTDSSTGYTVFTFLNFCVFVFTCNKMGQDCTHTLHICEQQ